MYNFTHNNHLKHFIDGELFGIRTGPHQQYTTDVGTIDHDYFSKNDYQSELLRVARLQYNDLGKDLLLFVSGGTDSEIMARSFARQGLKPKCIIIKFTGDYNIDDVREGVIVAEELGLPYEIVEFDVKEFYHSGQAGELATEIQCELLPFLAFFQVSKMLNAPTVLGGELLIEKYRDNNLRPAWMLRNIETLEAAHVRFANKYNIPFIIEWFSYTPELMLYYLEHPDVVNLVTKENTHWSITPLKNGILRKLVPDIRIKMKGTGYENLHGLHVESREALAKLMPYNMGDKKPYLTYDEVVKKLRGENA